MSGGSYNYLCHVYDADDLMRHHADLEVMAQRLERIGCAKDAAKETRNLIADLNAFEVRAEVAIQRLRGIWRAVEWTDSGDSTEDSIRQALTEYRGAGTVAIPPNQPAG